ncbi:hypothetical protein LINPERHAP1_LOCUS36369 [Linum perenne]
MIPPASSPTGQPTNPHSRPPDSWPLVQPSSAPHPRISYSNALTGISSSDQGSSQPWICVGENDIVTETSNGVRALRLSPSFKEKLCKPWVNTVVIRLIGKNIGYSFLCNRLKTMWKPAGTMHVIDVDLNCFLVRFGDEKDYFKALTGGPWLIFDHYLVVQQWEPSFRVSNKLPSKMVVWVRFPHLPIQLYHKQRAEYENLPDLCFTCGKIGHQAESCPSIVRISTPPTSSTAVIPPTDSAPDPAPDLPAGDGYGPWMTVARKSRRAKRDPQPDKERTQKGKVDDPMARSKAEGSKGKATHGKSKDPEEGSPLTPSSAAKGKEGSNKSANAAKGVSNGPAKVAVKEPKTVNGPETGRTKASPSAASLKASGPNSGPSDSFPAPPGPSKASKDHADPMHTVDGPSPIPLESDGSLFSNFKSPHQSAASSPPSIPIRQRFRRKKAPPPASSIMPARKSTKTNGKATAPSKGAKDCIKEEMLLKERNKAAHLAAEARNVSLSFLLDSHPQPEEMAVEQTHAEKTDTIWDLNNPSAEMH